jgi:hypothetical protein
MKYQVHVLKIQILFVLQYHVELMNLFHQMFVRLVQRAMEMMLVMMLVVLIQFAHQQ